MPYEHKLPKAEGVGERSEHSAPAADANIVDIHRLSVEMFCT